MTAQESTAGAAAGPDPSPAPGVHLLRLTSEQLHALQRLLEAYRQYALTQEWPTTARNARLRQTQALLGRLHELGLPPGGAGWLTLTLEELPGLQRVLRALQEQPALRQRYGRELAILAGPAGRSPQAASGSSQEDQR